MTSTDDESRLEALELEAKVEGHVQMSESGLFVLDPNLDLTTEEQKVVDSSLLYLNSQTSPAVPEAGGLLKAAADGYRPKLGWDRGWVSWSLAINGKTTEDLASAASAGSAIAGLVAAISAATGAAAPVAVIAAIAAAVSAVESNYLAIQNKRSGNHGVYWWGLNGSILSPPVLATECAIIYTRKKK